MEPHAQQEAVVVSGGEGRKLVVLGNYQTIKIGAAQSNGAFAVIEQSGLAGAGAPPHYHTKEDEIFYVLEGEIEFTVDGKNILGKAGVSVFLPRGVKHAFQCVGAGMNKVLIMVVPAGLEEMFVELDALGTGAPDLAKITAILYKYGIYLA